MLLKPRRGSVVLDLTPPPKPKPQKRRYYAGGYIPPTLPPTGYVPTFYFIGF